MPGIDRPCRAKPGEKELQIYIGFMTEALGQLIAKRHGSSPPELAKEAREIATAAFTEWKRFRGSIHDRR